LKSYVPVFGKKNLNKCTNLEKFLNSSFESESPSEINENWDELVFILKEVIKSACGIEIVQQLMNRIFEIYRLPENSKTITSIEDVMEVKNMLETKTKIWEKEIKEKGRAEGREEGREEGRAEGREEGRAEGFEKGFDIGLEKTAINMIRNGEPDSKITLYTGLSVKQIEKLRARVRKGDLQ